MTLEEFKDVARVINAMYGTGEKVIFDTVAKVTAWYSCLSDLPYAAVAAAVKNHAMTNPFPPKVADIRKECAEIMSTPMLEEQAAWEMVRDGIRNGIYGAQEEFDKVPPEVQAAVVTPWALSEWAMLPSDKVDTVIQSQFKISYRSTIERREKDRVLGAIGTKAGAMAALTENVAKRLEVDDGKAKDKTNGN